MKDRMRVEITALALRARLESLITEREGMLAFNRHRSDLGQTIGYSEESFSHLQDRIDTLYNEIMSLAHSTW